MSDELLDDLAAYIAEDFELPDDADEPLPPPVDADQANRMLHVVRRLGVERDEIVRTAQSEKARIDEWASDRTSGIERRIVQIERALEGFARNEHRQNARRKTLSFPNGTLRLRPGRDSVRIFDESLFVEWALANDVTLLSVKPAKAEIKRKIKLGHEHDTQDGASPLVTFAALTLDGEIVPGVVFDKPRAENFTLQPTGVEPVESET